jgi:hypothetical protein
MDRLTAEEMAGIISRAVNHNFRDAELTQWREGQDFFTITSRKTGQTFKFRGEEVSHECPEPH